MGHAEMVLAVAGMTAEQVAEKTRQLASDSPELTETEKIAFAFARKQAKEPWAITDGDIAGLEKAMGRDRAWQTIWWAARCHYMTKVADAFQLPLERENPFLYMPGAKLPK